MPPLMSRLTEGSSPAAMTSNSPATNSDTNAPMVALDDVRLSLGSAAGEVNILRGIELHIAGGEAVGVVGPSGSGKTTMMMVIAGLERASSGSVRVNGAVLGELEEDALARFRRDTIGIVFQNFHLIPTMTALENVAIPLEFAGRSDAFDLAREGLAAVGLAARIEHYPGQLSGGEKQRVALARAVAAGPRLIMADEPTGNLDHETGAAVMDLLFGLHDRLGTTLILISHDLSLAGRCDRVVRLDDGRITDGG